MAPWPGLVNPPVLGLHVDFLPALRELEPPGELFIVLEDDVELSRHWYRATVNMWQR